MPQLGYKDVKRQSEAVFGQFRKLWEGNSDRNFKVPHKDPMAFCNIGLGKNLVMCAMGASLEKDIEALKQYRDRVDIFCCDKAFGRLLDHGIKADYVMLADASIKYDTWLKPYIDQTKGVKLISTIYGNPEWTENWQGEVTFYMNKDAIDTQKHFMPKWGSSMRVIPASSNVSNAMIVFMVGCDDGMRINFSGYQNIYLTGYDYSWKPEGNYYAWENPKPKRFYMCHRTFLDINSNICHSSENLIFSAKWLTQYINMFKLPIVNCSQDGLLDIAQKGKLSAILPRLSNDRRIPEIVRSEFLNLQRLSEAFTKAEADFNKNREVLSYGYGR